VFGISGGLTERGLSVEEGGLVVIDGGKGLRAAIDVFWGDKVVVQRCQCHKMRNVLEKLPEYKQERVKRRLYDAWSMDDVDQAEQAVHNLAWELEQEGESAAAASLREGLDETLTCIRLGVPPVLRKSLANTNVIESALSQCEQLSGRVKYWRNGNQALRWAAATLMVAERSFQPIKEASALPWLAIALRSQVGANGEAAGIA